jgi:hypothetical protein
MARSELYQCQCSHCRQETAHPDQERHRQMNLLLSRLDEQQRRWYVAVEANRIGSGGQALLSQITGLDEKTIRRGQQELEPLSAPHRRWGEGSPPFVHSWRFCWPCPLGL